MSDDTPMTDDEIECMYNGPGPDDALLYGYEDYETRWLLDYDASRDDDPCCWHGCSMCEFEGDDE